MATGKQTTAPRVSSHYHLGRRQPSLDFVDVRIVGDTPLFIDPAAIAAIRSPWTDSCTSAIQGYFQRVLDAVIAEDGAEAVRLLSQLGEDNSTRLGFSRTSRGSGLGRGLAEAFFHELATSKAVSTGLIRDVEDTALLIEGVGVDRVSDVTTNIIRGQLISYTQDACRFYGIPLLDDLSIGPIWDERQGAWVPSTATLPMPKKGGPLLLVPKSIVRRSLACDPEDYFRHYVLTYLRDEELRAGSSLVRLLKSGRPRVTKKSVEAKYRFMHAEAGRPGIVKRINLAATTQNPDLLDLFKSTARRSTRPVGADVIAEATGSPPPDFDALLEAVITLPPGPDSAGAYERAIEALLSALFYPSLVNPVRQENIHEGRKRIDISYTNEAAQGFFGWLANRYPAANVVVECKNYSRPLGNPEYDQIAGRFSPSRGKVGLLVYRDYEDKAKILDSCHDTAADDRGFILALDDADLSVLVSEAKLGSVDTHVGLLRERFRQLTA